MGQTVFAVLEEAFNENPEMCNYASHYATTRAIFLDINSANDYVIKLAINEYFEDFQEYKTWKYRAGNCGVDIDCGTVIIETKDKQWMKFWCERTTFMC